MASIDYLYVRNEKGKELDDIEVMFSRDYENDIKQPLERACRDSQLSVEDWRKLIDFVGVQMFRTPAYYERLLPIMEKSFEKGMDSALEKLQKMSVEEIYQTAESFVEVGKVALPFKINRLGKNEKENYGTIEVEGVVGKSLWFWAIENVLPNVLKRLHSYKWSILLGDDSIEWPTSDNPVVCLNHVSEESYELFGGVGKKGTEIIFPISRHRALYTQVGVKHDSRIKLDAKGSRRIKDVIIENAYRYIYAYNADNDIQIVRPRCVDLKQYQEEKKKIEEWYKVYLQEESIYYN